MVRNMTLIFALMLILVGCSEEKGTNHNRIIPSDKQEEAAPHYQNVSIYEIHENSIMVAPPASDPEASYLVYEILIDEKTIIEGSKNHINELVKGDNVKVWLEREEDEIEVASKMVVT